MTVLGLVAGPNALWGQDLGKIGKAKPFHISGSLSAGISTYSSSDSIKAMNPLQWTLSGSPVVDIYGLSLPFNVFISSQDKGFSTPFTRFGVSPYYKWAKLHLGWQSLDFNRYTLGGQQILGTGAELTPGKFDAAFMYGRFNHAVTDLSVYNNLNNEVPVHNRNGYAFKIGYGDDKARISISYLRAKDKVGSANPAVADSSGVRPAANQVFGLRGRVAFFKHFSFQAETGLSIYTSDTGSDSIDPGKYKHNIFLRSGMVSHPNFSTSVATAIDAGVNYSEKLFSVGLQYQRVDPDYRSMGAFYLQTDIEQYTLNPSLRLARNTLYISGSMGIQRNNLGTHLSTSSSRKIGMLSVSYNPNQTFGVDISYSNYGISQQVLSAFQNPTPSVPDAYDSVRISEISQSFTIAPHLSLVSTTSIQVFSLTASVQNLKDHNELNKGAANYTSTTATLNHNWELTPKHWNINQTLAYINTKTSVDKIGSAGYTLALAKALATPNTDSARAQGQGHQLSVNASGTYYINLVDSKSVGSSVALTLGVSYRFLEKHSLEAGVGWIGERPSGPGTHDRNELTTYLRYHFSF